MHYCTMSLELTRGYTRLRYLGGIDFGLVDGYTQVGADGIAIATFPAHVRNVSVGNLYCAQQDRSSSTHAVCPKQMRVLLRLRSNNSTCSCDSYVLITVSLRHSVLGMTWQVRSCWACRWCSQSHSIMESAKTTCVSNLMPEDPFGVAFSPASSCQ